MIYYTADPHLGHDNIRKLCNRPFATVEEMDETIINNWNSKVTDKDDVYILGDFSFKAKDPTEYLKRLKGKKHLIVGNHDSQLLRHPDLRKYLVEVVNMKTIIDNGTRIVLCHYPLVEWDGYYKNTLHFYGHVHNSYHNETTRYASNMENAYNVGMDVVGFYPMTLDEILELR